MKTLTSALFLILSITTFAQSPIIEWQNTIGGYNDENLKCIRQTSDGGYILGGESYSGANGDKTESKIGDSDYWVVKLDAFGNIVWQNTIGGSSIEILNSIEQTSDGGYIIAGYSLSPVSGDKTEASIMGSYDYWIIKLNSLGNIIWQNTIGGNGSDKANSIIQTNDGGYILGGYSISGISGDKTEANLLGTYDFWIIKIDVSGNIVWQNNIGGNASDKLNKILQLDDGNYIVGGTSASGISGDKTEVSHLDDYWVIKLDASGNIIWQNTIGGSSSDRLYDLDISPDGGYILGGSSISNVGFDKSEPCIGPSTLDDYWIVKLTSTGIIMWENTIGGNKDDNFSSIDQSPDGGIIIGGFSLSDIYEDKTEANWNTNTSDYWVIKLESAAPICEIPSGLYSDNITSNSAKVHWTSVPSADSYKVYYRELGGGSWTKKTATLNFKNLSGLMPSTTYEWKVRSNCAVETSDFSSIETFTTLPMKEGEFNSSDLISIYPNPAKGNISITVNNQFNINSSSSISIYDLSGKMISQILFESNKTEIDLSEFSAGIYLVKVNVGQNQFVQKLIIE